MARVGRLAGAIVAETGGEYFLVGNTKRPCDWATSGFETPATIDARATAFVRLRATRSVDLDPPVLVLDVEGEDLARMLAQRFVIERNGAVSDRLWRLVVHGGDPDAQTEPAGAIDARWLGAIPGPIWQVVRDTVLRCV